MGGSASASGASANEATVLVTAAGSRRPEATSSSTSGSTARELTRLVCDVVGYAGTIEHDLTKPDGTPRKLLDVSRLGKLGWHASIALPDGIRTTYQEFLTSTATPA